MLSCNTPIPRLLYHIWIGPYPAPSQWMKTWPASHPHWQYKIFGNDDLNSRKWRLEKHIQEYIRRHQFAGAADLMRYEILSESGGFLAPADSVCINHIDNLFTAETAYVCRENDIFCPNSLSPVLACPAGHPAAEAALRMIEQISPADLGDAWVTTGNLLMGYLASHHPEWFTILPSRSFVPRHHSGLQEAEGPDTYARQFFGSGTNSYDKRITGFRTRWKVKKQRKKAREYLANARKNFDPARIPWLNMNEWGANKVAPQDSSCRRLHQGCGGRDRVHFGTGPHR